MNKILIGAIAISAFACQRTAETPDRNIEEREMTVNDPHTYAQPDIAVVTHLDWKAHIDFDRKIITGEAAITYNAAPDAETLILDTKGLEISEVLYNDSTSAEYSLGEGDEILGKPLVISIREGEDRVNVKYTTSTGAEALQWLSAQQTAGKKHPFLFTQSQAILARSWIPLQDSPGIRFSYDAQVTIPKELLALMSAENPQEKNETGIYNFKMAQPVPAYLMALSVGDLEFRSLGERSGVYAEPSLIERSAYEFGELDQMISTAEDLYGPYRWERYDIIVLPPSFPFGGMENPRLTFATPTILAGDRSLTSLVAHELAHSWSGNLVTNATWNDFWLNEGFTVYFEQRIMEAMYGREYSEMLASLSYEGLKQEIKEMIDNGNADDTKLKLNLAGRNPDDGVTSIAYDKGYLLLRYIEEQVGREKFDLFLRKYFKENAFKVMSTEEFLEYMKSNLFAAEGINYPGENIEAFIYKTGLPDFAPQPTSDKFIAVENQLQQWLTGKPANQLKTNDWSSHEWMHFIRSLPDSLSREQVRQLDQAFGFTASGNSEVLTAWLVKAIGYQYEESYAKLEEFLINTGRRKFLMPLYKELVKTNDGEIMARKIYAKARPNYHFVSSNSIDELLKWIKQ